jgi:hypothetical protein
MDDRQRSLHRVLRDDLTAYARACLKIRPKKGGLIALHFNATQRKIHAALEEQRARTGKVRAMILKSRQPGCSTYVEARFFHRVTHGRGLRAFILTHEDKATDNLFEMVDRYYQNLPMLVRPHLDKSNAKELSFDVLDSGYQVATARTKGAGRSSTIQLFHGSECASWSNAEEHVDGVLQAVAGLPGTEIILESTAQGKAGLFYLYCQAAMRGEGEFILIFVPWFEHEEYEETPPHDWLVPQKWRDYQALHCLTDAQLWWAYQKNHGQATAISVDPDAGPCWKFRQEYPATAAEAFQVGDENPFIPMAHVEAARKAMVNGVGPLIFGVDPARGGGNRTTIMDRRGRCSGTVVYEKLDTADTMRTAARVAELIRRHQPTAVNVDTTGVGAGVYDRLVEYGFEEVVRAVQFGSAADDALRYVNKRSEMWDRMREWLSMPDHLTVAIPDEDELDTDLTAPVWKSPKVPNGCTFIGERLQIEKKDSIEKRLGISPDFGDALALTFAFPSAHVLPERGQRIQVVSEWDPLE